MLLLPEIILPGSMAPAPVTSMALCLEVTVIVIAMVEEPLVSPGAMWNVPAVEAPIGNLTMVTVTRAAPLPQGRPRLPMGVAVEAVAMTTMEAVPGMAMAAATVTPAVGVRRTLLAVASAWAGRRGGPPPRLREATPLVMGTAARAAERPAVAAAVVESIEGWPAAVTEKDGLENPNIESLAWR